MNAAGLPCPLPGARLRRLRAEDLAAFQAYRAIPELGRYQGWTPQSDADAATFLANMAQAPLFTPGEWVQLGIADASSDRLLGDVGLFLAADGRSGEVGFTLEPAAQGRGLATAAVAAALELFFQRTQAQSMLAITDTRNGPSLRLLRRLGFQEVETRTAIFRGERCDETVLRLARQAALPGRMERLASRRRAGGHLSPSPPAAGDRYFGASVAELYESHLVPLIFEPYARDIAQRLAGEPVTRVLEVAAGTGVVTRELARTLPAEVAIIATDLNPAMLERAAAVGTARPVEWRQADAMALPFGDAAFDALACQFGAMFFPDARTAFAEARRVLRPGSLFLFNVWDRIEDNEFADVVTTTVTAMFPDDPPLFLRRTPHGHHDAAAWLRVLGDAGFTGAASETVEARSEAGSAERVAVAYCQGTPLRNEIEARAPGRLDDVTAVCARALVSRFGEGRVAARIQALVLSARA